jgi:NAD(P)-dependent dehydrogenase (short-subunit alcohol dehydrogenase family)
VHVRDLFDLSGRVALVTGGGRGIGHHIAMGLAEAGADVFVASRKLADCEQAVREIEDLGRRGVAIETDLASASGVEKLADRVLSETDRLHILVNNAGMIWGAPTLDYPLEAWDRVFAVNVRALWRLSQRFARHMKDAGGGAIINISSISARRGATELDEPAIAYSASKGAVNSLTLDLGVKLAPDGVRVNAVAPGLFDTSMMDYLRDDDERLGSLLARVPMGRAGQEDDIKAAVVFLASDAAQYVTAQTIDVDGGWGAR